MDYGRLDVFWPDGKFETFALNTASVSVGRSTGNTISLDTDTISRYHFSITHDNQIVAITDLDSANGTYLDGVRLESNKPYPMLGGEEIQIGQLRMIYQSIDDIPTLPITTVADDTQRIEQESAAFRMEVYGPEIAVPPGSHTFVEVSITNLLDQPQQYGIRVSGLPEGWLRLNRPEFELDPQESTTVLINIKPFRTSESVPGKYPLKVAVTSRTDPASALEAEVLAHILPFSGFGMALSSHKIASGEVFRLHLHNQGSANLPLQISGHATTHRLLFGIPTPQVILAPGQRQVVQGEIKPQKARLFGAPQEMPFDLIVRSRDDAGFVAAIPGKFIEKPALPTWAALSVVGLLLAVIVLGIIGVSLLVGAGGSRLDIRSFEAETLDLNQGDPLQLRWDVAGAEQLSISLNGQVVQSGITPEISSLVVETSTFSGVVVVELIAERDGRFMRENFTVQIDPLLSTDYFEVTPAPLVRNVVQAIDVRWGVSGAVMTQLSGLEAFTTTQLATSFGAEGSLTSVAGVPTGTLSLRLIAESADGERLEELFTVEVIDPTCTTRGDLTFYAQPDPAANVVGTVQAQTVLVVDRRDVTGAWIRAMLPGGVSGWGARTDLSCAASFSPEALLVEVTSAGTPTGTAAAPTPTANALVMPTLTAAGTPRPTSTPGPVPTVRP